MGAAIFVKKRLRRVTKQGLIWYNCLLSLLQRLSVSGEPMIRAEYFNYIEEKLNILAYRIENRGKLNILELNIHSENFFLGLFNHLFGWNLQNLNAIIQNSAAIDLVDTTNRIIIQVSATASKQKVESALSKKDLLQYTGYCFKFIAISKDASKLREMTYNNPYNLTFVPQNDIHDIPSILSTIIACDINRQKLIYEFVKKELGTEPDPQKVETNLAAIINILAKEDWDREDNDIQKNPYDVERKIEYNRLNKAKSVIDDYKIHNHRVDRIYSEFNKQGVNKCKSVLDSIRRDYTTHKSLLNDDELFFRIIQSVIDRIHKSDNYVAIPFDELELCVNILVVDAFIRCKIFENPEGYTNVAS